MLSRRRLMVGAAAAGAGMVLAPAREAASALAPAPALNRTLEQFVKMRGALDERLVTGFVVGRFDGVVDGEVTPLFGVLSAVFSRYRRRGSEFVVVGYEQAYYTDLQTGQVVDHLKNPYTGEVVAVPVYSRPPTTLRLGADLQFRSPVASPPNAHVEQFARPPETVAGDLIFVEEVTVTLEATAAAPEFRYRDHTVLRAKRSDVERGDTLTTRCQTTFDATCSWRPWLKMGTRPGYLSALGFGSFGAGIEAMAPAWVEATKRANPDLLDHPERALEPAWSAAS